MTAALAWADRQFPALRKTCIIEPGNQASINVALKHGFKEFWRTTYNGRPMVMFERRSRASEA